MENIFEVHGYKAFDSNCCNRHGIYFEAGKTYSAIGNISFGVQSTAGFHMCKNMEDTFRYVDADEEEVEIAEVTGRGNIVARNDEYYGYFDMYAVEEITIERFLSRDEIINYFLFGENVNEDRVCRMLQTFKIGAEEIEQFRERYGTNENIITYLEYYQIGDKTAFERRNQYQKRINRQWKTGLN